MAPLPIPTHCTGAEGLLDYGAVGLVAEGQRGYGQRSHGAGAMGQGL